jgi:hypothetical protein
MGLILILLFSVPTFAAEKLKNLEITYDNYYAKIKIKNRTIKFEDPYLEQVIRLRRCNRTAWNNLLASLSDETKDYELLVNTQKIPNADDDVFVKRNDSKLRVTSKTSLGNWSRKISDHWNELVAISKQKCEK